MSMTRVNFLGHPVHVMLMPLPIGLLSSTAALDAIDLVRGGGALARASSVNLIGGLASGAVAGLFGAIDYLSSVPRRTRAKRLGAAHGIGNLTALALFGTSLGLRLARRGGLRARPPRAATLLEIAGAAILVGTAWLGAEMVNRLGVGVYEGAGPDAPSSLRDSAIGARLEHLIERRAPAVTPPPMPAHP
jgi:uncharacterized membrane protein